MYLVRLRTAVATFLVAAACGLVVLTGGSPAYAATCSGTSGVSLVVEFNQLGGGVRQECDQDGAGRTADRVLKDAGFSLGYVQRFPGFVCRIDGLPADDPCVDTPPADAYWGLWWSDGRSGTWTYSSLGAGSLTLPAGAYVAMVWDGSSGTVRPTIAPAVHATPTPTPTRSPTPTRKPSPTQAPAPSTSAGPTSAATSTTPSPSSGSTHTAQPKPTPSRTRTPSLTPTTDSPTASPTDQVTTAAGDQGTPPASGAAGGGLPGWLPPVLVAALLVAAGAVALARRRSS